jgi:hypothetical protein
MHAAEPRLSSSFAVFAPSGLSLPAVTQHVVLFAQLHGRVVANERFHREGASVDKWALLGLFTVGCGAYVSTQHNKSVQMNRRNKTQR